MTLGEIGLCTDLSTGQSRSSPPMGKLSTGYPRGGDRGCDGVIPREPLFIHRLGMKVGIDVTAGARATQVTGVGT